MNKSMDEVLKELKRPFHSSKTQFKVASNTQGKSALCVAYVDARHVQERLNEVCEGFWSNTFREVYEDDVIYNMLPNGKRDLNAAKGVGPKLKAVEATITIEAFQAFHVGENVTKDTMRVISHSDIGAADNVNDDFSFGWKALYSDAFKRAGVHFGIAAPYYYMPKLWLEKNDTNFKMKTKTEGGREVSTPSYMKPEGEAELRKQYIRYLTDEGVEKFGEPL